MAGSDFRQLREMQKRLERAKREAPEAFCRPMAQELAARLLRKTMRRTPVDTGTLRRAWTASVPLRSFNHYSTVVTNNTQYASYVEYGHRTRDHTGWVPGRFMLTLSANQLKQQAPALIQNRLADYMRKCLDGE